MKRSLILTVVLFSSGFAAAQEIPPPEYLTYMPLNYPRTVNQTDASAALHLFGDRTLPGYRDVEPRNGIDDVRDRTLMALAVRFAPYLIANTTNVPMDFRGFWNRESTFPITVDTFDTSGPHPRHLGRETIDIANLAAAPCEDPAAARGPQDDCKLLLLMREFDPLRPAHSRLAANVSVDADPFKVMYFDWPGEDEASWRREYEDAYSSHLPRQYQDFLKIYPHPFINEVRNATDGLLGYELVIQYWYFFPLNDGGNNHEGDWEHINVVVAPRSQVTRLQTADELLALLATAGDDIDTLDDPLVIKRQELYFHHKVMTLDFAQPNVYAPREVWQQEMKRIPEERRSEHSIWKQIREQAYWDEAETIVNTHAFGYIGADNKGLDQLLSAPGGKNRDSHGTYPFPGMYKDIGPAGATEQISAGWFRHKKWYAAGTAKNQEFGPGAVVAFDDPELIEVVPDWERVHEIVYEDVETRRHWSWMVLPLRWGYPAVVSPFAGVISYADTGNVGPVAPHYQGAWNRSGPAPGYEDYAPHKLASLFPLGWQDNFVNSWGFLNITAPTLVTLPPFDFIWRIGSAPFRYGLGRPDPVYYPQEEIPPRFVGVAPVYSVTRITDQWDALWLNESQLMEILQKYLEIEPGAESLGLGLPITSTTEDAQSPALWFGFFLGKRLVSENMVRHSRSNIGFNIPLVTRPDQPLTVAGDLNFWEYSGSLRYNLSTGGFKPFVKAGWGLSWYRIENGKLDGEPMANPESPWVRQPTIDDLGSFLPNTWNLGAGLEFDVVSSLAKPPKGIDVSVRADWAMYFHPLGIKDIGALEQFPSIAVALVQEGDSVVRHQFNFMLTLGF